MDKWLDKLIDNRNFMKLVALVMALLLFGSIYDSNNETNDINIPGEQDKETIADIPVKSYFDTDNLVVSGVPETVKVTLKGPKPNLQNAKAQKDFEVYADLSQAKVGRQRVQLQIRNLSDKLSAEIDPEYVNVTVQEKVSKEFNVEVEFNKKMVAEGYEAGPAIVKPGRVKVTGGKSDIESISYVKAIVETGGNLNSTFDKSAPVFAFDKYFKKLNVTIEQETVRVTIPIKLANKKVPIEVVEKGTPPDGVTIDSITLDTKEVKISGSEEVLNATEKVRIEVDVSTIGRNTELDLPIIIPEGIKESEPKMVKAAVKVTLDSEEAITTNVAETKTFSDLPISITGLSEELSLTFQNPPGGKTSVTVKGTNEEMEKITESDFQLSLNAANLKEGEHEVQIQVTGPENANWSLANEKARIIIQAKQLNNGQAPENGTR
ncbi:CdaR family protein [Bacillus benzoevorans]|uniref:YbbR domain-containing protein n=1 Tax=Bacillus benzoevorans TaxID=1456 RepID=A0A7X0LYX1_9BACI|nr:CdaR family protein [Bacillus benzoevorans]MBB6447884.1 YbbR domain-containing protein [Bacillus benzoevorans]